MVKHLLELQITESPNGEALDGAPDMWSTNIWITKIHHKINKAAPKKISHDNSSTRYEEAPCRWWTKHVKNHEGFRMKTKLIVPHTNAQPRTQTNTHELSAHSHKWSYTHTHDIIKKMRAVDGQLTRLSPSLLTS